MQSAFFGMPIDMPIGRKLMGTSGRVAGLFRPTAFAAPSMPVKNIEIIGLAGAGKSTFVSQLRRQRPNPAFWATKDEVFAIHGRPRISQCDFHDTGIDVLKTKLERVLTLTSSNDQIHRTYYNAFMQYFDFVFLSSLKAGCHVVHDEGFFYTFRTEMLTQGTQSPTLFADLVRRQAFVAILCTPSQSVENLRARAARGGKVLAGHRGLDDTALLRDAEADLRTIESLLRLARQAGVPVLEIESGGEATANAARFAAMFR